MRRDDLSRAEWDALSKASASPARSSPTRAEPARGLLRSRAVGARLSRGATGSCSSTRPQFDWLASSEEIPVTFTFDPRPRASRPAARRTTRPAGSPVPTPSGSAAWATSSPRQTTTARPHGLPERPRGARLPRRPPCCRPTGLGDAAIRLHDPATAAEAYAGIDLPRARTNRALALLALGQPGRPSTTRRGRWSCDPTTPTPGSRNAWPANASPTGAHVIGNDRVFLRRPAEVEFSAPCHRQPRSIARSWRIPIFAGLPERVIGLLAGQVARA